MFNKLKTLFKRKPKPSKIQQNREKHKNLKKLWDSTKSISGGAPIELLESYYDKDGNIYYIHKNITDLHISRQFEFNKAMQGIEWGVTTAVLKGRLKQIDKALNSDDPADKTRGLKAVSDLQLRMERIPEKRMFLELAMALIYRHDENPYIYETAMRARKIQDIARDPNLESFFFVRSLGNFKRIFKSGQVGRLQNTIFSRFPSLFNGEGNREDREEYWIDAYRKLFDNYQENAYIVSGEDSHLANQVQNWTVEQYYTALVNLEGKIERIRKAKQNQGK